MCRYTCFIWLLVISLGGCAGYPDANWQRLESLPQHYRQFDMDLAWQVKGAPSQTVIDGVLQNHRFAYMENIELWVAVVDAAGRTVSRSVDFVLPRVLPRGEIASFSVKLPGQVAPGTLLRFTYRYTGSDAGQGSGGQMMQSFDAVVPRT